jgi:hypothetical protein
VTLLVILLGAVALFGLTRNVVADTDIWWHLKNAELLVKTGSLPMHDVYSFTVAGKPWINPQWLAELPYYFAWRAIGERGIFLVCILTMQAIIAGVFYHGYLRTRDVKASFFASFLALVLAEVSFSARTLLFGWLFFIAEMILLFEFREGKDHTWLLPFLFCIWINAHGSWLIGLVFAAAFFAGGCVGGSWGLLQSTRWTARQARKLVCVGALSLAALFVNPYGWRLVAVPFDMAFQQKMATVVNEEWQSTSFHDPRGKLVFVVISFLVLSSLVRKRRWALTDVFFLLIASYSALAYERFVFLLGIVICPMLAEDLRLFPAYEKKNDKPLLNALIIAGILLCAVLFFPREAKLREQAAAGYPSRALPYLQSFHPNGRVLNDFNWGGYLIWNTPHIPVFIDGRGDIYDHYGVFADYMSLLHVENSLDVLNRYHIQYVFFAKDTSFAYLMRHTPGWKIDYEDDMAIMLERIPPANVPASALALPEPH